MTVRGLLTPVTEDGRTVYAGSERTPVADSNWESGYYFALSGQDHVPILVDDITLADGKSLWMRPEWAAVTWASLGAGTHYPIILLNGSRTLTATNPRCYVAIDGNTAASPNVQFVFVDANGNVTVSGSSYTYGLGRASLMVRITQVSSTQVTCELFEGTTSKMTITHNAAGGVGTLTFKGFRAGFLDAPPKGATAAYRVGTGKVHDSTGTGPGAAAPTITSRIQANTSNVGLETGSQPTSIPDENDFRNTADSAAAAASEVDDPWGTPDTTRDDDFNQSTATTLEKVQSYGFSSASLGLSAGDLPESNIDSAHFKVVKEATGGAVNIKVHSVNRLLYYEPSDRILAAALAIDAEGSGATGVISLVFDDGTEVSLDARIEANYPAGGRSGLMRLWTEMPSGLAVAVDRRRLLASVG